MTEQRKQQIMGAVAVIVIASMVLAVFVPLMGMATVTLWRDFIGVIHEGG